MIKGNGQLVWSAKAKGCLEMDNLAYGILQTGFSNVYGAFNIGPGILRPVQWIFVGSCSMNHHIRTEGVEAIVHKLGIGNGPLTYAQSLEGWNYLSFAGDEVIQNANLMTVRQPSF